MTDWMFRGDCEGITYRTNAKEPAADGATNSPEEATEPPAGADSEAAAAAWEPWHRWDLMVEVLTFNGNLL